MADEATEIPFNRPTIVGRELEYIRQTVESMHTAGDGEFTRKCTNLLKEILGVPQVLLTTSCTDALEMSALLLDIEPGDEVIVPAYSFVSTVNAFILRGARPVFADIRPDTLNLDEARLETLIGPKTRAIVLVHYNGVGCEMDAIVDLADRSAIPVVEDNAHGLFARYRGKYLGTFGALATQSFHETKNIICGEGGALVVNDPDFVKRAEVIRDKGTNRQQLFRGEVDKYTWVDIGSSFVLSDMLAAFLYAQLEQRQSILQRRRNLWNHYDAQLRGWIEQFDVQLPYVPEHCEQGYHMYYLVLPSLADRQALIDHLRADRIDSVFHYTPLHLSRMGLKFGGQDADCPVTEKISDQLLRLPFFHDLGEADQDRVLASIRSFFETDSRRRT